MRGGELQASGFDIVIRTGSSAKRRKVPDRPALGSSIHRARRTKTQGPSPERVAVGESKPTATSTTPAR
jgi:hypothetical protein